MDNEFGTEVFGWGRDGRNGRPPIYEDPEELQESISNYFNAVANGEIDNQPIVVGVGDNRKVIKIPKPTITGLVLYCGFADRQSFHDYEKKQDFSFTIKRARSFIEHDYELQIRTQANPSGAIFALKNFGWKDTQQITLTEDTEKLTDLIKQFAGEEDELEPPDDLQDDSTEAAPDTTAQA